MTTAATPPRPGRRAFTLVELLIVLTMIAIVAGFAVPRVDTMKYRSDAAARSVVGQLQGAQRTAVTRQLDVLVSFDVEGRRVRVLEDTNRNGRADDGERASWRVLPEETRFAAPPAAVTIGGGAVVGRDLRTVDGLPTLVFRRDGSASGDAEIYITSPRARAKDFRALLVTEATGRAEWMRYTGDGWTRAGL